MGDAGLNKKEKAHASSFLLLTSEWRKRRTSGRRITRVQMSMKNTTFSLIILFSQ
jgi:hypothetical protein